MVVLCQFTLHKHSFWLHTVAVCPITMCERLGRHLDYKSLIHYNAIPINDNHMDNTKYNWVFEVPDLMTIMCFVEASVKRVWIFVFVGSQSRQEIFISASVHISDTYIWDSCQYQTKVWRENDFDLERRIIFTQIFEISFRGMRDSLLMFIQWCPFSNQSCSFRNEGNDSLRWWWPWNHIIIRKERLQFAILWKQTNPCCTPDNHSVKLLFSLFCYRFSWQLSHHEFDNVFQCQHRDATYKRSFNYCLWKRCIANRYRNELWWIDISEVLLL